MLNLIRREPALIVGIVVAVITLIVAFGVPIDNGQKSAIVGLVGAILSLLGAGVTRSKVTPVPTKRNESGQVTISWSLVIAVVLLLAFLWGWGVLH